MHNNSLWAYHEEETRLNDRARKILSFIRRSATPLTIRQIKEQMGFDDMNEVRPRVTDLLLINPPVIEECKSVRCPKTGRTVMTIRPVIRHRQEQLL